MKTRNPGKMERDVSTPLKPNTLKSSIKLFYNKMRLLKVQQPLLFKEKKMEIFRAYLRYSRIYFFIDIHTKEVNGGKKSLF